jgi:hypothetical protein
MTDLIQKINYSNFFFQINKFMKLRISSNEPRKNIKNRTDKNVVM